MVYKSQFIKNQLLDIFKNENNIDIKINQDVYPKPDWAVKQIVRSSGLVEDICKHGIGHPNVLWLKLHDPDGEKGYSLHGCDGCCSPEMREAIERNKEKIADKRTNTPSIESGRCDKT